MRTFKFRVWSKKKQRFLHSHKNKGLIFGMGSSDDSDIEEFGGWDVGSCVEDKNLVVQQFTGLLDKNGKEIYEGDLLEFSYSDGPGTFTEEVYFSNHFGSFAVRSEKTFETFQDLIEHGEDLKVVGNIFERRLQEQTRLAERLKGREKPNLDEVDFGAPHWREE